MGPRDGINVGSVNGDALGMDVGRSVGDGVGE